MKKFLAIAVVAVLSVFSTSAEEWDIFALSFTENAPADSALTDIYGIKVGAPISGGPAPVYGVEASVLWAGTLDVKGVKCSLIGTDGSSGAGLQLAIVNFIHRWSGLQLGIFNYATDESFQIGLVNIIKNSPVPFLPIINCRF
ncbi:MAG: hypothetical protein IKC65_05225 [Lentisphaeria bacterium]|nr:hypothetical protein [Lentisphaeria bacterium]